MVPRGCCSSVDDLSIAQASHYKLSRRIYLDSEAILHRGTTAKPGGIIATTTGRIVGVALGVYVAVARLGKSRCSPNK